MCFLDKDELDHKDLEAELDLNEIEDMREEQISAIEEFYIDGLEISNLDVDSLGLDIEDI